MSSEHPIIVGNNNPTGAHVVPRTGGAAVGRNEGSNVGTFGVKSGLAQMLKGGVIMVGYASSFFIPNRMLTTVNRT